MADTAAIDFMGGTTDATITYNPKGALNKDDFLKLLMVSLQYQDPTDPMDTDKMLSQTSDMAVIESQANIQKEMENMVAQFKLTSAYQLVGAVGKLADTGLNAVQLKGNGSTYTDSLYYEEDFDNAVISITDSKGNTVKSIRIENGAKGLNQFTWDGKDTLGNAVEAGTYAIYAEYTGKTSGASYISNLGVYPIESIVLDQSDPKLYLGGEYYSLSQIVSIKDKA
ncbi:MAG: flagellar hook capping protein [Helicobacteraceae bacterium]|jgi:flagellar basal-body rod modification protein FlgD|nr:flagellar hook capping protein [Helicobacteraceae bacterium]